MKYLFIALIGLFSALSHANECDYIAKLKEATIKQYNADQKATDALWAFGDISLESQGLVSNVVEDAFKLHMMDLEHFANVAGCK